MAPRPYWKGYLKLSLVTCPVAMTPAVSESEKVKFHTLNKATGNRVASQYVDAVTRKPLKEGNEVKGYERGENDFIILEDDELDAVALESTRTINIEMFTPRDSIDWVYLDKPHYLTPADQVGLEAFSVIRDAMATAKVVGISRLVIGRRERAVMMEPRGNGIVVWTLRYGDEVRSKEDYFAGIGAQPEDALRPLVQQYIADRKRPWDPAIAADPVQAKLLKIIAAKRKALKPTKKGGAKKDSAPPASGNVVSIMEALQRSIASDQKAKAK
jgi:DNA end-binding protein Ku